MNRNMLMGVAALIVVILSMITFMPASDDPAEGGIAPGTPPVSDDSSAPSVPEAPAPTDEN